MFFDVGPKLKVQAGRQAIKLETSLARQRKRERERERGLAKLHLILHASITYMQNKDYSNWNL